MPVSARDELIESFRNNISSLRHDPVFAPVAVFWDVFKNMRDEWFWLVPLLLWAAWRAYRGEQKRAVRLALKAAKKAQKAARKA